MKLVAQRYLNASGEKKVNCYKINISKKYLEEAGIKEDDDLVMYVQGDKIVVKKKGK